jgi:hypothetical protein
MICDTRKQCPGEKERRTTQATIALTYSTQQFLNNGMDTNFV